MDAGIGSINYKGTSVSGVYNNGSATSQINFRGNHDLGGGMKADFRVETDWNTVTNSGNTGAKNADGTVVNRWTSTGFLAASATSNETAFMTYKAVRSTGMVVFDNQARV